jgi:hypothetical protein
MTPLEDSFLVIDSSRLSAALSKKEINDIKGAFLKSLVYCVNNYKKITNTTAYFPILLLKSYNILDRLDT